MPIIIPQIAEAIRLGMVTEDEIRDCPDCGVHPGEVHSENCDVQRCTVCRGQKLSCGHPVRPKGFERAEWVGYHRPREAKWTGLWPGVLECRELGWLVGGEEDLNRWAIFSMTGRDPYQPVADKPPVETKQELAGTVIYIRKDCEDCGGSLQVFSSAELRDQSGVRSRCSSDYTVEIDADEPTYRDGYPS